MSHDQLLTETFCKLYYASVAPDDLADRTQGDIEGAARSHLDFATQRPAGTALCRVLNPSEAVDGWCSPHTVVQVVCDDMPFLVDSVIAELTRHDLAIERVVHPQIWVIRDAVGQLQEVLPSAREGSIGESFIQVEVNRHSEETLLGVIRNDVRRVLEDVRAAVEDWGKMRTRAEEAARRLSETNGKGPSAADVEEACALLRWLTDNHFTFLGFREYELIGEGAQRELRSLPGTGLGILRDAGLTPVSRAFASLPAEVRARALEPTPVTIAKANSRSTVHRPAYLDYLGVKVFDADGQVTGELRFLGLFSRTAYTDRATTVPMVRTSVAEVIRRAGFAPVSHDAKHLRQILEDYPRDELFQISVDELYDTAMGILHLQERRRVSVFARQDPFGRFASFLVFLPRERFSTEVRKRVQEVLREAVGGVSVDYDLFASDSVLLRLHVVVHKAQQQILHDLDVAALEKRVAAATRTWDDEFARAYREALGDEAGEAIVHIYGGAFPEAYKEDFPPAIGVLDARRLGQLGEHAVEGSPAGVDLALYKPLASEGMLSARGVNIGGSDRRFKIFRIGESVSLATVMPLLADMGAIVSDERPYGLDRVDAPEAWIYDFGLSFPGCTSAQLDHTRAAFQDTFEAVWQGLAESDPLNGLVVKADLSWREIVVLRAYTRYLRQVGTTFTDAYLHQALISNAAIAASLIELFKARLDPERAAQGDTDAESIETGILAALDDVGSLDEDRILRSYLTLVNATLRTNYFQRQDGAAKSHLSFKLEPQAIPELVAPVPMFEIFVYSPRVEGVHLRFGPVARGGLRWSDRREDFRTEILGLVKAQSVKNAVIVPVGSKGGFFAKKADPSDRDAFLAEGVEAYKTFIRGMLDLTDNYDADGVVVPPERVRRHDDDDPYLVVAADKGTATFSDIANGLAAEYGFWLGDAFASGGSAGYDHKTMGITARGAWESVKRHFRELGTDIQAEQFTAVGVGDMSGDVFGNGMLLSHHTLLIAAFDHRHIFLDPTPDAAASFAERRRLFDLSRSSWADYDSALISAGGGVYPRTAKAIELSAEAAAALGMKQGRMTPAELMRGILLAPVDLLWNGGIGRYVKSTTETHVQVGDKANDSIRVNGGDLRAQVVGEGGNLGCTQLGRIEFAKAGGRSNTDAIDNSAGVDTSDHEVNIKILLGQAIAAGVLKEEEREPLLASMTDEVAALVLADNYAQNVALGNARAQAHSMLRVHQRYIHQLTAEGYLDRALEFLPDDTEIDARFANGGGLTSPELAVLLAYTKIVLTQQILESDAPEDPVLGQALVDYFPTALRERFRTEMGSHRLARQIISTVLVNRMVNHQGTSFAYRIADDTAARPEAIMRAHAAAWAVFGIGADWSAVEALDGEVATDVQTSILLDARRLVERATRWIIQHTPVVDIAATTDRYQRGVAELSGSLEGLLNARDAEVVSGRKGSLETAGVPTGLATRAAGYDFIYAGLDIVEIATASEMTIKEVASAYFALDANLGLGDLRASIESLPRDDRWQTLARGALRDDLFAAHAALTRAVIGAAEGDAPKRYNAWEQAHASAVQRVTELLADMAAGGRADLATLSVALRQLRAIAS